ncbi:hypothetical protein ABRY23_05200 [Melioribacteraceae bacterium 4301-Me]|uniref:hypothetical protein n=1 Tax=Pyranulibacter aquaticus TaxID=3163344 RepID=UPI003595C54C
MISVSIVQIILFIYYSLTKLVDLYPFNNIREFSWKERFIDPAYKGILLFIPPFAYTFNIKLIMLASLFIYVIILIYEIKKWWIPYLFKPSENWLRKYDRIYKDTVTFLPPIKDNPIPTLEKVIFHLFVIATFALSLFCYLSQFNK